MPVALDYMSDHLVVRLVGPSVLASLRRNIVIPYSDIAEVSVEAPRWPSMLKEWRIGTHLPGVIAQGLFSTWNGKHRRFVHFERSTKRVLTLRLSGHPDVEEVSVEVRDPEAAQKELLNRSVR